jgi:hypothetical protein
MKILERVTPREEQRSAPQSKLPRIQKLEMALQLILFMQRSIPLLPEEQITLDEN